MRRARLAALCALLVSAPAGAAAAPDGAALFAARCAGICHQNPLAVRLTPKQWQVVIKTMQSRITQAGLAPLSDEESRAILHYLTTR